MSRDLQAQANALIVQRQQTDKVQSRLVEADEAINEIADRQHAIQDDLDALCALAAAGNGADFVLHGEMPPDFELDVIEVRRLPLGPLDQVEFDTSEDWNTYFVKVEAYALRNKLTLSDDPFTKLLSPTQRVALERRIKEEFSLKNANCDKFDYMIAGTCGLIGGLVDILFVGLPGVGPLTRFTDEITNKAVQKFATFCGWPGSKRGNPMASAIGYLENGNGGKFQGFRVNYDHATGKGKNGVGGAFEMRTANHHIKSIGHWPDLVGLFFSILDQFTSTAHFVDGGKIISIKNDKNFELSGSTIVAKIFAGFVNWFGHLISDVAGSSGSAGNGTRGSGIPIPFFGVLQFLNVGKFQHGDYRETFAKVAVRVFESGYDLRHGMALAIPVLVTDLMVRVMWTFKARLYHDRPWVDCIPSASNPELRRMLLVGHGTLCIVDGTDAALRSGGEMIQFMLRTNLIGWARFGTLAVKELRAWYRSGSLDVDSVDAYLDAEYERVLAQR